MRILLFGKSGQVGWELQRALAPLGEVVALDSRSRDFCGNLADLEGIGRTVCEVRPDWVINAAAHTAVDKAESEKELSDLLNHLAPAVLAKEAGKIGARFVHYSTDYVFDGSGDRPWKEGDPTGPLGVYGESKLNGEKAIAVSGCRYYIFRTCWVYAARGKNFAKTILKFASGRERLTVIDDQWGAPTGAELIADVTAQVLAAEREEGKREGVYHLCAAGETTWHGYATFLCQKAAELGVELKVREVAPVPTSEFPTPAKRPANSRLCIGKIEEAFGFSLPDWRLGVSRMLEEILPEIK